MANRRERFGPWMWMSLLFVSLISPAARAQYADDEQLAAEQERQVQIAERFLGVLEQNPRRGTALDRVYGHHVEFGTLNEFLQSLQTRAEEAEGGGVAWMLLGLFEAHRGEDANAVDAFREAEKRRPADALAPYYLAQSLLLIGQPERAVEALERALERNPARTDLVEIYQQLGRVHQRAQRTEEAFEVWQRLEAQFPNDLRVQEQIAVTLVEEGEYALALPRYEKLAELVRDDYRRVMIRIEAAQLKIRESRRDDGLQDLEQLLADLNPDSWLHRDVRRRIEDVFLRSGDQDGLVKYYEKWIADHPEDVDGMARLARFLASSARVPEATEWMEKALRLAPSRTELRKSFIDQLVDEQRFSEAIEQYALLVESSRDNPDYLREWGKLVLRDKSQEIGNRQQEAARIWSRITAARPEDAVTTAQVADLFRHAGMNDQAIALYQKAVELAPSDPQYREYLGEFYHVLKRPDDALLTWSTIAEDSRHNVINVARLAEVYNSFGYLDQAVQQIAIACDLDPKDFSLQLSGAEYHARANKFGQALEFVAAAEGLTSNNEQRDSVIKQRIEIYQSSRQLDEQIERLAAELGSNSAATSDQWHVLARYYEADRRWADAIDAIQSALAKDEQSIGALATAARIAELSGNFAQAASMNRRLAQVDRRSRSDHLMNVARLEAQMGRSEEALEAGRDLIVSAPGNTDNYEFYAQLCFRLGKQDEGLDALRKAVRINPTEPHLITALGSALAEQFRTDEAIEVYWRAFEKTDDLDDQTSLTIKLTELYLQLNQFDKLIERFERERQEDEKRRGMTIWLAQAHHASGDYGTARQELESLLSQDTRDTNLLQQLSKLCEEGSDLDAAVEYQRQLVRIAPGNETEYRLANLLQSRGDRDEASEILVKLTRREEDPERLLRSLDSLLTQGSYESAIAIMEPLLSQRRDDWELLYREAVAWASLENQQEAKDRCQRLLALAVPHDMPGVRALGRLKQAQARARSNNLRGLQSTIPQRQSPLTMLGMSSAVRRAVGLDSERYYSSRPQSVWTPDSFGIARMAAYGWLLKFNQDDLRLAKGDLTERPEEKSFTDQLGEAALADNADRQTIYDWLYVEQLRGNLDSIFRMARRLAREGGREEQTFFLSSLRLRGIDPDTQQVQRSGNEAPTKDPLSEDDLELMLACHLALTADQPTDETSAASYGGQVAYSSDGRMYVNVGGNWIQVSGATRGSAFLGTVIEELKLAGRDEQSEKMLQTQIAAAETPRDLTGVMNLLLAQEDTDRLHEIYDRWVDAAADELARAPAAAFGPPARRTTNTAVQGLGPNAYLLTRWMGKLGPDEEHAKILAILDSALDLAVLEAQRNRANRPSRPPSTGTSQNYGASFNLYYGKENIYTRLDYPQPNEYVGQPALMLLREVYEVFKRNDVLNDLPDHLRQRTDKADQDDSLYNQLMLGYVLWWCEEQEEAVEQITAAADQLQDNPAFRVEVAALHESLGDFDTALDIVESIAPRDQRLVQQRELMALQLAERLGDIDRARQAAERLFGLRLDNNTQLALVDRMRRLGMLDMAEAVVSRVHRRMGSQTSSLATLMALYQGQGKVELAEQIAHSILQRTTSAYTSMSNSARNPFRYQTSDSGIRTQALRLLQQTGSLKTIIERIESQLARSPASPRLYGQLIEYYQTANQREKVQQLLEQAVAARPDATTLRYQLAKHFEQSGKLSEACDHYLEILDQEPGWVADDLYSVRRVFERAQRSLDLMRAVENMNLQALGHPYYVIDLIGNMLDGRSGEIDQQNMDLAIGLFERLFDAFPTYRNQMISRVRDGKLWKNERIYELGKKGIIPSANEAKAQPWYGINDIYSYSSGGTVTAMFHQMLNGLQGTDRLPELQRTIEEVREKSPEWHGGEAMLALIDLKENRKEEAKARLGRLVADEDVFKTMPADACWIVGQELDKFEDTREVALELFEHAVTDTQSRNQIQYSPVARLVKLYGDIGEKQRARDLLLKQMRTTSFDQYDAQYSIYMRVENTTWGCEQLLALGFAVDAVRFYRELGEDPQAIEQAGQRYGNRPDYFADQIKNGFNKALAAIEQVDAGEAMAQLLTPNDAENPSASVLDLMVTAPDAKTFREQPMSSPLIDLLVTISEKGPIDQGIEDRLAQLLSDHPADVSVAVTRAAYRLQKDKSDAGEALEHLLSIVVELPLERIPEGRRPNSRQRREALPWVSLWLVARECLPDDSTMAIGQQLAERALEGARRQFGDEYVVAILYDWGRLALEAGDRETAETKWSQLLDVVTTRPERKAERADPKHAPGAPQPVPLRTTRTSNPMNPWANIRRLAAFMPDALLAASDDEKDHTTGNLIPPLTVSQFRMTIEIALAAAENGMSHLSRRAVKASLAGGVPITDVPANSIASSVVGTASRTVVYTTSASPSTPAAHSSGIEAEVAESLLRVLDKWQGDAYRPTEVYELLCPIVLPAARHTEILMYADSSKLRDAKVRSLGGALVGWAAKANLLDDLETKIVARNENPAAVIPGLVMQICIALAANQHETAADHLSALADAIEQGTLPQMVQLACHAAIPATNVKALEEPAYAILKAAIQQEAQPTDRNDDNTASLGPLARKVNRFLANNVDQIKEFYESYLVGRQAYYSRYSGDYGQYLQWRDWASIAQEAAIVGVPSVALDFMGRVTDFSYERYSRPSLTVALAVVCRELNQLSPEDRFQAWSDWTLPVEGRQTIRMVGDWVEPVDVPETFLPDNASVDALHTGDYLCNLVELVKAAEAADKLDELRQRAQQLYEEEVPKAAFLRALVLIQAGDLASAQPVIGQLIETMPERTKQQQNQPPPDLWGDFAVFRACSRSPDFATVYGEEGKQVLRTALRNRGAEPFLVRLDGDQRFWEVSDEDPTTPRDSVPLTHWLAASSRDLISGIAPWWVVHEGHLAHLNGRGHELLCFAYPLTGDFQFSVDCYEGYWAECDAGYGGIVVESQSPRSNAPVWSVSGHESIPKPAAWKRTRESFNRVEIQVADGTMQYYLNKHLVYEEKASPTSPWLQLFTTGPRITTFRNLSITGKPVIPREASLLNGDRMDGWCTQFLAESQPRQRLMAAKPQSENDSISRQQRQEPNVFDWHTDDGVLLGESKSGDAGAAQSWVYYYRPLQQEETFRFEFYYVPGQTVAHPTIGRLAFLLEPTGVDVHWIGRRDWDDPVLGIPLDNQFHEPSCRRGPDELPLVPNDWNLVELTLTDGELVLQLNGTLIYQRTVEPENDSVVGLFRYKRQATKVRNAVLTGPWPEQFDAQLNDDLLATVSPFSSSTRQRIHLILGDHIIAHDAAEIVQRARSLPDESAYELLIQWVLPSDDHLNSRLYFEHLPITRDDGADKIESDRLPIMCPAVELVNAAGRLGRIKELTTTITEMDARDATDKRNKLALLALSAIELGNMERARTHMAELYRNVDDGLPQDLAPRDRAAEFIVAWRAARQPALRLAADDLAVSLRDKERDGDFRSNDAEWRRDVEALAGVTSAALGELPPGDELSVAPALTDDSAAGFTQWQIVPDLTGELRSHGRRPSEWRHIRGVAHHIPGGSNGQLYFQSPLRGKFEIIAERSTYDYREVNIAYGMHAAEPRHDLKAKRITTVMHGSDEADVEIKLPNWDWVADFRIVVDGAKVTTYTNGVKIHDETLTPAPDPWVVLQAGTPGNPGTVRNLRLIGTPEIPDEINLIDIAGWASWRADMFGERFSTDSDDENAHWRRSGDEIHGQLRTDRSASPQESLLMYQRPMLEDGEIQFESYYVPGEFEVHPAVGRAALLVGPGGVKRHTLTDGAWETTGLLPGNEASLEDSAPAVMLKVNDWNRYRLTLSGDVLTLSVNDKRVAEFTLNEPAAERYFGLFRYADQTKCHVRNLVYRGEWPKELPPVEEQELAYPTGGALRDAVAGWPESVRLDLARDRSELEQDGLVVLGNAEQLLPTASGLRMNLAASSDVSVSSGLSLQQPLEGDCEVIVEFDQLQLTPAGQQGKCAFTLKMLFDSPERQCVEVGMFASSDGQRQLRAGKTHVDLIGNQRHELRNLSGLYESGQLSILRLGPNVHCLFAEDDAADYRLLGSFPVGLLPISEFQVQNVAVGKRAAANVTVGKWTLRTKKPGFQVP